MVYFRIGSGSWANIEATKSITLWKVTESPIGKDRLATTIFQGQAVKLGCLLFFFQYHYLLEDVDIELADT